MISVACVGFGWWGQVLAKSVAGKSDKITITKVTTRTLSNIEDAVREIGAETAVSYDAVLADPGIDAVVLATPHSQHADQIVRAAAAGKHVFVEKPMTLDAGAAREAFAAAKAAGVVLAVGHNRRFHPSMIRLKKLADSGALGRIVNVEGNISAPGLWIYKPESWRRSRAEQPAGGMTGLGIHLIDAVIALAGPVSGVTAEAIRLINEDGLDEVTTMLMRMRSGARAYIGMSIATNAYFGLRVFGTDGWAEIRNADLSEIVFAPRGGSPEITVTPEFDTARAELEAFADAVQGAAGYPVPEDDVVHGIEVMCAAIEAAGTRKDVTLPR